MILRALVLLLLAWTTQVSPQSVVTPGTAEEAHDYLMATFTKYRIGYLVWHGVGLHDYRRGTAQHYNGVACLSDIGTSQASHAFTVDWSKVASVSFPNMEAVFVTGQLARTADFADRKRYTDFHLYAPDERVARSIRAAMEVIRQSCRWTSKFG